MPNSDRRRSLRYHPTRDLACLGWWGAGQFRNARARLINLSTDGALISVGQERPGSGKVWFCLAGQDVSRWVGAEVVGVTAGDTGSHLVRLTFHEGCPYDVFRSTAWGEPITEGDIAIPEPPGCFVAEKPSTPLVRARRAWIAESYTRCSGTAGPSRERPSDPQEGPRQSSGPDQSKIEERNRFHSSLPWITAFVIDTILVFWLGVFAAQKFQDLGAFWIHLGH
jgi:hypothetical protein